jgi:hypothetical protein
MCIDLFYISIISTMSLDISADLVISYGLDGGASDFLSP